MRPFRRSATPTHRVQRLLHRTGHRWLLTAGVALGALLWTLHTVGAAEDAQAGWGRRRSVPIAVTDLEPGRIITEADISFDERPVVVLPDDLADSPVGRSVTRAIGRREPIVERRLAARGASAPTALLGTDAIAFAIPVDASTPLVRVGDRVMLFAPPEVATSAGRSTGPATRVAESAVVVAAGDRSVTVGVERADAPAVARALLSASVIVGRVD